MTFAPPFDYPFEQFGEPDQVCALSRDECAEVRSKLPACLADVFAHYGRFTFRGGLVNACCPSDMAGTLEILFDDDRDFRPEKCHAFAYTAFGDLTFWLEDVGLGQVSFARGVVTCLNLVKPPAAGTNIEAAACVPFVVAHDFVGPDGKHLFARAAKRIGAPGIGECFGFFPALAIGGEVRVDSLRRVKAAEHFAILAQLQTFRLVRVEGLTSRPVRTIGARELSAAG